MTLALAGGVAASDESGNCGGWWVECGELRRLGGSLCEVEKAWSREDDSSGMAFAAS